MFPFFHCGQNINIQDILYYNIKNLSTDFAALKVIFSFRHIREEKPDNNFTASAGDLRLHLNISAETSFYKEPISVLLNKELNAMYPFPKPEENTGDDTLSDFLMRSSSGTDCTGLIPTATEGETELENYNELYDFLPTAVSDNKNSDS